ncbi:MAG: 4Fe-4S dicluster domain-containing protein [Desulfobacteraceae bacterium]|nr:4Fe-4S dicluster domain-containing protein [Desulfobacteraceae bacterium]
MSIKSLYDDLQVFMDKLPSGYPKTESGVEIRILKKLFTPEQAKLFMKLTLEPETVENIAKTIGLEPLLLEPKLEKMAFKGLIFRERKDDEVYYKAFQFIIGIYEFQLNTIDKELAQMIEEYLPHYGMALVMAGVKTKQLRVAPVSSAIDTASPVASYNMIREQLKNQELIAIQNCICRKEQGLLGKHCDYPHESCFSFGNFAQYYIENKMARKIDLQEAMKILDIAEESGLILSPSNSKDMVCICCCCPCCCPAVKYSKLFPEPVKNFKTFYQAEIDPESCTSCQECFERCPMEAIQEGDGTSKIKKTHCIGCGLCVSVCPEDAISLQPLSGVEDPPEFMEDTFQQIKKERNIQG